MSEQMEVHTFSVSAYVTVSDMDETDARQWVYDQLQRSCLDSVQVSSEIENENVVSIKWSIEDVESVVSQLRDKHPDFNFNRLTKDDKREILRLLKNDHDATIGVNWDVIENYVWDYERKYNE